jgi:hypothetical protein
LKLATRSSTESELVALEVSITYAIWWRQLLKDLEIITEEPIIVYQDNKSSIIIALKGGNFDRTKHMISRREFVKQAIQDKEIVIQYCNTKLMLADILTKPVTYKVLSTLIKLLNLKSDKV